MGINYNSLNWWGFSGSKTATLAALDPGSFKNRCWTGWIRWDLVSCNPIKKPEGSRDLETQPWGPGCFWLEGSSALFWGVKKRPSKTFGGSNTFTLNRGHGWVLGMSQKIRSISPIISIILWPGDGMFRPSVLGEIGRDLDSQGFLKNRWHSWTPTLRPIQRHMGKTKHPLKNLHHKIKLQFRNVDFWFAFGLSHASFKGSQL